VFVNDLVRSNVLPCLEVSVAGFSLETETIRPSTKVLTFFILIIELSLMIEVSTSFLSEAKF